MGEISRVGGKNLINYLRGHSKNRIHRAESIGRGFSSFMVHVEQGNKGDEVVEDKQASLDQTKLIRNERMRIESRS